MCEERFLNLYKFLPEAEKMSQQQNEQDGMRMMNLLNDRFYDNIQNRNLRKYHNKRRYKKG